MKKSDSSSSISGNNIIKRALSNLSLEEELRQNQLSKQVKLENEFKKNKPKYTDSIFTKLLELLHIRKKNIRKDIDSRDLLLENICSKYFPTNKKFNIHTFKKNLQSQLKGLSRNNSLDKKCIESIISILEEELSLRSKKKENNMEYSSTAYNSECEEYDYIGYSNNQLMSEREKLLTSRNSKNSKKLVCLSSERNKRLLNPTRKPIIKSQKVSKNSRLSRKSRKSSNSGIISRIALAKKIGKYWLETSQDKLKMKQKIKKNEEKLQEKNEELAKCQLGLKMLLPKITKTKNDLEEYNKIYSKITKHEKIIKQLNEQLSNISIESNQILDEITTVDTKIYKKKQEFTKKCLKNLQENNSNENDKNENYIKKCVTKNISKIYDIKEKLDEDYEYIEYEIKNLETDISKKEIIKTKLEASLKEFNIKTDNGQIIVLDKNSLEETLLQYEKWYDGVMTLIDSYRDEIKNLKTNISFYKKLV